ncbi:hypothetical protein F4703DRAFT_1794163 [Phycomyces blakesleeanus]
MDICARLHHKKECRTRTKSSKRKSKKKKSKTLRHIIGTYAYYIVNNNGVLFLCLLMAQGCDVISQFFQITLSWNFRNVIFENLLISIVIFFKNINITGTIKIFCSFKDIDFVLDQFSWPQYFWALRLAVFPYQFDRILISGNLRYSWPLHSLL